jgi:hypothetical protein
LDATGPKHTDRHILVTLRNDEEVFVQVEEEGSAEDLYLVFEAVLGILDENLEENNHVNNSGYLH